MLRFPRSNATCGGSLMITTSSEFCQVTPQPAAALTFYDNDKKFLVKFDNSVRPPNLTGWLLWIQWLRQRLSPDGLRTSEFSLMTSSGSSFNSNVKRFSRMASPGCSTKDKCTSTNSLVRDQLEVYVVMFLFFRKFCGNFLLYKCDGFGPSWVSVSPEILWWSSTCCNTSQWWR